MNESIVILNDLESITIDVSSMNIVILPSSKHANPSSYACSDPEPRLHLDYSLSQLISAMAFDRD